jgi:Domain of unknown function (DUF5666)
MKRRSPVFPLEAVLLLFSFGVVANAQDPSHVPSPPSTTSPVQADKNSKTTVDDSEIMDRNDPMFGVPKMPKGKVSLIGGVVEKTDPIRQRLTLRVFGNNRKMEVGYDERSHIYRDGVEASYKAVQRGDRVYVDSMLDGSKLFARNIRVVTTLRPADARGQIINYNARSGFMTVRDDLSSAPVTFRVTSETQVKGSGSESAIELVPGSLVTVHFSSDHRKRDTAQEVTILAMPGALFTFAGKVRHLDVKTGVMAIENTTDNQTYELHFDPNLVGDDITIGSDVEVSAEFQGQRYRAKSIKLTGGNSRASQTN